MQSFNAISKNLSLVVKLSDNVPNYIVSDEQRIK